MNTKKIAIDGPSGAGKSTMAKLISKLLSFVYVDTGAMYRGAALFCLRNGVSPENEEQVLEILDNIDIDIRFENGHQYIYLADENVTDLIRTPEVSMGASAVSKHLAVREKLVSLQQAIARRYNVIMDGRDIATKVIPDADVAIFLTADPEVRAKRRYDELIEKGIEVSFEEVLEDMLLRDKNDSTRANSPLKKAENAILVDTTDYSLEESVNIITDIIMKRLGKNNV